MTLPSYSVILFLIFTKLLEAYTMKYVSIVALFFASFNAIAATVPGDVNIVIQSSDYHTHKFRLIINNSAATSPTTCAPADTGTIQTLSYGSIGTSKAKLTLQVADCDNLPEQWVTFKGNLDYDSNYWYELYVDMIDKSFFL